jgi:hypothetical protein
MSKVVYGAPFIKLPQETIEGKKKAKELKNTFLLQELAKRILRGELAEIEIDYIKKAIESFNRALEDFERVNRERSWGGISDDEEI